MKSTLMLSIAVLYACFYNSQESSALNTLRPYSITFSVNDMDVMSNWYVEKLGFKVMQKTSYAQFNTSLTFIELNGYRVELIKDGNAGDTAKFRPDPPSHTSLHGHAQFCFYTDNLNTLEKELTRKQIKIVWKFRNEELNVKFLFIRDPENNLIQFLQKLK